MNNQQYIRNFAIVAHIDHGKSTLADRLLEKTGTIKPRDMQEQVLDSNPIERERGITIKLAPVRMKYSYQGIDYILNLIDTPGHVDFSYEVSRSLSACEGILLVIDATAGIQAQTLAHMKLVKEARLKIIPIINKIDLPSAKIEEVKNSLCQTFSFDENEILKISAKNGININKVLEKIVSDIPSPQSTKDNLARGLVFSSIFDSHKGVVIYVRVFNKEIRKVPLKFFASKVVFKQIELGFFTPQMSHCEKISVGEVGYIATGLKDIAFAKIVDTVGLDTEPFLPLSGYREPKLMVFLTFYPINNDDFLTLLKSIEKLHLSDSSFTYSLHSSAALGKGYLC